MASKEEKVANQIIEGVGGLENISAVMNCQTRVRLQLVSCEKADDAKVKAISGVYGTVVAGNTYQVVVGPGQSSKLGGVIKEKLQKEGGGVNATDTADAADSSDSSDKKSTEESTEDVVKKNKAKYKKAANPVNVFLKHIGNIFVPIIPAFIGCGLLLAVNELLIATNVIDGYAGSNICKLVTTISSMVFVVLPVVVGYNTMNEFGGSGVIGAVLGGVMNLSTAIKGLELFSIAGYTAILQPGRGGIFTVLLLCICAAQFEKFLRKFIPDMLDTFLTPFITIVVMSMLGFVVFMPICGALSDAIGFAVAFVIENAPWAAGIVTMFYLPLVVAGIHHGLIAINTELVATTGVTPLLPVTCMSGGGQVGAAFYVFLKTKNKQLKKTTINALPVGMLGVGEPLLYGVTVPLGKPFIASCLGGAVGGSVVACLGVVAKIPELSGLQLSLLCNSPLFYLIGMFASYVAGFFFCMILGFDDPVEE